MIDQNNTNNQLPNELRSIFSELGIFMHLRKAGITKTADYPGKDVVYRFLNQSTFNWRRFLLTFSAATIEKVDHLTDKKRPKVLIIDDSSYDRNRSKKVELLARCFDHASLKMLFYKGFRMLTLD